MTATTTLVRSGMCPTVTADGVLVLGKRGPDIYARVEKTGFMHWEWEIFAGPYGEPYDWGSKRTKGDALVAAIAAAHRTGGSKAATR
jgi:hypothetical protein